jgi:hypothetical protein
MYVIVILLVAIFAYSLFKEAIDKKVKGFSLSNIQRKFAIVGLTAFIVWLLLAIGNDAFSGSLNVFQNRAIWFYAPDNCDYCYNTAHWPHLITFMTWVGSLIAFFIYKD